MPASTSPKIGFSFRYSLGESGWNTGYDANWRLLDILLQGNVVSATTAAQPGSPTAGQLYIVPSSATGDDWAGQDGKLAYWDDEDNGGSDAWVFLTAGEGWQFVALDTEQPWVYDDAAWKLLGSMYGQYADDSAAASGGVPVGGLYVNSSSGSLQVRLS